MDEINKKILLFIYNNLGYSNFIEEIPNIINNTKIKHNIEFYGNVKTDNLIFKINNKYKRLVLDNNLNYNLITTKDNKSYLLPGDNYIIDNYQNKYIFKLKDYKKSALIFGYKNKKKELFLNKTNVKIVNILLNYKCKKDGVSRNVVEVFVDGRKLKMLASEIIPVYPDIKKLLNNYNPIKDRKIRQNSSVYVKHHKTIPYKEKCIVKDVIMGENIEILNKKTEKFENKFIPYYNIEYNNTNYILPKKNIVKL